MEAFVEGEVKTSYRLGLHSYTEQKYSAFCHKRCVIASFNNSHILIPSQLDPRSKTKKPTRRKEIAVFITFSTSTESALIFQSPVLLNSSIFPKNESRVDAQIQRNCVSRCESERKRTENIFPTRLQYFPPFIYKCASFFV